jgi:hypothetical protein
MTTTEKTKDRLSHVKAKASVAQPEADGAPGEVAADERLKEERKFARRARKVGQPGEQFKDFRGVT